MKQSVQCFVRSSMVEARNVLWHSCSSSHAAEVLTSHSLVPWGRGHLLSGAGLAAGNCDRAARSSQGFQTCWICTYQWIDCSKFRIESILNRRRPSHQIVRLLWNRNLRWPWACLRMQSHVCVRPFAQISEPISMFGKINALSAVCILNSPWLTVIRYPGYLIIINTFLRNQSSQVAL